MTCDKIKVKGFYEWAAENLADGDLITVTDMKHPGCKVLQLRVDKDKTHASFTFIAEKKKMETEWPPQRQSDVEC